MMTVTCKIPEQLDAELAATARRRRVPKSRIIREALEQSLRRTRGAKDVSADDLAKKVRGSLRGPADLATNPAHMEGFGA